jgi:hypothetical protein
MNFEDKIEEHMTKINAILTPDEQVALAFYGIYNVKGWGSNPDLTGTWAATNKRLLFTGKAKFSSGWSGFAKAGKVIEIPYQYIVEFSVKKQKMKVIHTCEFEGKKPGAKRPVTMMPHKLKDTGGGKKESDKEWIARAEQIYNKLNELMGRR